MNRDHQVLVGFLTAACREGATGVGGGGGGLVGSGDGLVLCVFCMFCKIAALRLIEPPVARGPPATLLPRVDDAPALMRLSRAWFPLPIGALCP